MVVGLGAVALGDAGAIVVHGALSGVGGAESACAHHCEGRSIPVAGDVSSKRTRGAEFARVVEGESVALRNVLVARGAGQAFRAGEGILPYAVASAARHVDGVLSRGACVTAPAVCDSVAVKEAASIAGGFCDCVGVVEGNLRSKQRSLMVGCFCVSKHFW